jgi:hypothetical protein
MSGDLVVVCAAGAAFHSQGFGRRTVARVPAPGNPFETFDPFIEKLNSTEIVFVMQLNKYTNMADGHGICHLPG